jgi:hypothetical protein
MGPALSQPILIGWHEVEGALKRRVGLGWGPEPVLLLEGWVTSSSWHHADLSSSVPHLLAGACSLPSCGGPGVAGLQERRNRNHP